LGASPTGFIPRQSLGWQCFAQKSRGCLDRLHIESSGLILSYRHPATELDLGPARADPNHEVGFRMGREAAALKEAGVARGAGCGKAMEPEILFQVTHRRLAGAHAQGYNVQHSATSPAMVVSTTSVTTKISNSLNTVPIGQRIAAILWTA